MGPASSPFRASGKILSNHFEIVTGKDTTLYEYPVTVVQTFPPPRANHHLPRRLQRRVIYLFIKQLTSGAINPVQPPAQPPADENPSGDNQGPNNGKSGKGKSAKKPFESDKDKSNKKTPESDTEKSTKKTVARPDPPPFSTDTLKPVLPGQHIASDYLNLLVTVKPIPNNLREGITYDVIYYEDWATAPSVNSKRFGVTITSETRLSLNDMNEYLTNPASTVVNDVNTFTGTRDSTLRALNIVFSNATNLATFEDRPRQNVQTAANVGPKKFYNLAMNRPPTAGQDGPWFVSPGIEALPGFFISARAPLHGRLLLNVNTTTSAFYQPGSLQTLINNLGTNNLPLLQHFLRNLRVETNYLGGGAAAQQIRHSITGLPDTRVRPNAINTSITIDGNQTNVHAYFTQRHPIASVLPNDIVVKLGGSIVPARCLTVLHGSPVKQKTDMVANAARLPNINLNLINGSGKRLLALNDGSQSGPARCFNGLGIQQDMVTVDAKVFGIPPVGYRRRGAAGNITQIQQRDGENGAWNLGQFRFNTACPAGSWSFIELTLPGRGGTPVDQLYGWFRAIEQQLPNYGIRSTSFRLGNDLNLHKVSLTGNRNNWYNEIHGLLNHILQTSKKKCREPATLFFVLLPKRSVELYSIVKAIGDQALGVHTICQVCHKFKGPSSHPANLGNLFMKFNLKLHPHGVNQNLLKEVPILTQDTMLIGLDVVSVVLIPVSYPRRANLDADAPWHWSTGRSSQYCRPRG
jgi:hypothetical protein